VRSIEYVFLEDLALVTYYLLSSTLKTNLLINVILNYSPKLATTVTAAYELRSAKK